MSEPKLISPMLDNFDMGGPISDHNGVRCCPAMRKNSDDKYIVKIISIPESQTKLDALLLTGAFSDNQSALSYFEELANGIVDEKKILDNLSQLEGFVSFDDCQIVPMEDAVGYDVYLLGEYRRTLERQNAKQPMTQLAAVNLGLDLCAALSACRRSGYLFVDLKPSNIYIVGDKEYKIGDLGFVRLNSLKYESLPDKYRSCYTAPELEDVFATLNDTIDIYSVGLILYQVFNGGILPFEGKNAPNQKFEAPAYADAEMAEIILKACDPDPDSRWQDPVQMGQAIVSYMQKNGVSDVPLTDAVLSTNETPETTLEEPVDPVLEGSSEAVEDSNVDAPTIIDDPAEAESTDSTEEDVQVDDEEPVEESIIDTETEDPIIVSDEASVETVEIPVDETSEDVLSENQEDAADDEIADAADEYENLSFLENLEEAEQILADVGDDYEGLSDDISDILDQVDALATHDVPAPVVAPDPVEIKIPDPLTNDVTTDDAASDEEGVSEEAVFEEEHPVAEEKEISEENMPYIPKKKRTGLVLGIILAVLLGLAAGAYYFYSSYYLQPIHSLVLDGSEDRLQVVLSADVDEALLTVVCADAHGNKVTAPVVGGKAAFSGLAADTAYTVSVEIDGFHKLTGTTSKVYSTPVQTKIAQMRAITGAESGSVILSFAIEGPDSDQWCVIYNAEGEAERVATFSDHMVTLTGLTVGKEYSFRLEPVADIYVSGETEMVYVAKDLICAENLRITSFVDGVLTAQWDSPADKAVSQWSVRCYNDNGYNETVSTAENVITFQNLDESFAYSIEVAAADMSVHQRVSIGANAITIQDFDVADVGDGMLSVTWNSNRAIPAEGLNVYYSVSDISAASPITVTENTVQIPAVPTGNYVFTIMDATGNAVLGGPFTYSQPESASFDAYGVTKEDMTVRLCKTPDTADWTYQDLEDEDYVNTFSVGEKISAVFACDGETDDSSDEILITYVVYDEDNTLVSFTQVNQTWNEMWDENYCELDVPTVPVEVGMYNVIIHFNGAEAGSQKFEITV